nr:hypothetical protein [Streptomyces sp.]
MHVRIALDVICVHSYLGYTRFTRAAERLRAEGRQVRVEFLPFELAPGAGTEGEPLLPVLERVFGAEAVRQTLRHAEQLAAERLELHYERAVATGTFEAHRLIARAARQGRGEQMVERLFRAHFTDGRHIGDATTLARLDEEVGVTEDDGSVPVDMTAPARAVDHACPYRCAGWGSPGCRCSSSTAYGRCTDPSRRPRCSRRCARRPGPRPASDRSVRYLNFRIGA